MSLISVQTLNVGIEWYYAFLLLMLVNIIMIIIIWVIGNKALPVENVME